MYKIIKKTASKKLAPAKRHVASAKDDLLRLLAFENSLQANIITLPVSGKIIIANKAACKLLGYSEKELVTKSRVNIFDITESSFKKMLQERTAGGESIALVTAIQKDGKPFPCKITSAIFMDKDGIKKAITTIADLRPGILKQKKIDTKKEKIVSDNIELALAKQKNIDTENEKIVSGNIAVALSKQKEIDSKKEKIVSDNIELALAKQKNIDAENEKIVSNNIAVALSKQKEIDTKKEKIVSDNIELALAKQKNIDTKNEKIVSGNIAVALSKQKEIDSKKEKIVSDNIELALAKQKNIDTKNEKIVSGNIAVALSKQKKIDSKREKIVSGNIKLALAKSGKEILAHETQARKKLLIEIEVSFRTIFDSSSNALFDTDLAADTMMINDSFEKEFGYKKTDDMGSAKDWTSHIHPEDKEAVIQDYARMLESRESEWKYSFRLLRADNSIANVLSKGIILRNPDGKAYRGIGYLADVSKQTVLEERLEQEIKLKEIQIAEAAEDAKEAERSDIGRELHDNVNQLLSVSRMYLAMAKHGGANSEMYLNRSAEYTLTAIEEIRKLTKGLTTDIIKNLGLCEAIDKVSRDTMEVSPVKISCATESFIEASVNDKFKLNIFRIIQEHLNNILKHASATKISIQLLQNNKSIILSVSDNGIGFDTNKKREGIGMDNIKSRAASYNGKADFVSQSSQGCLLTATFPVTDALLNKN